MESSNTQNKNLENFFNTYNGYYISNRTKKARVAQCSLNQSALDFAGNKRRIIQSIREAKAKGCTYRTSQESEIPGYGCEDHFMEIDTFRHSWEVIADILREPELTNGIIVETTLPIYYRSSAYNCKVLLLEGKIIAIRPKIFMADGQNYRESRYFSNYKPKKDNMLEEFLLPEFIEEINGQRTVPFGLFNIRTRDDVAIGLEICEEVWRLNTITRNFILDCDVVFCSNASHFQLNKLNTRIKCVHSRTSSSYSGAYFYTNSIGCDGGRLLFDGSNFVIQNQELIHVGESCPFNEVIVNPVVLDIGAIQSKRLGNINDMRETALLDRNIPEILIDFNFCISQEEGHVACTKLSEPFKIESENDQYLNALSGYLWDFLKKTSGSGFMLALSGGADSGLTAVLVYHFCHKIMDYLTNRGPIIRKEILDQLRMIVKDPGFDPSEAKDIVKKVLYTAYMGTTNSSKETKDRAQLLASQIGLHHQDMDITLICDAYEKVLVETLKMTPKFKTFGGTWREDLALQNVQARVRMVMTYFYAQLVPVKYNFDGFLVVLACGNIDEGLIGYATKYDCGSGDLNPIGSINKVDALNLLQYLSELYPELSAIK